MRTRIVAAGLMLTLSSILLVNPVAEAASKGKACNVDGSDYVIAGDYHPSTDTFTYDTLNAGQCTKNSFDADLVIPPKGLALKVSRPGKDGCDMKGIFVYNGQRKNFYVKHGSC